MRHLDIEQDYDWQLWRWIPDRSLIHCSRCIYSQMWHLIFPLTPGLSLKDNWYLTPDIAWEPVERDTEGQECDFKMIPSNSIARLSDQEFCILASKEDKACVREIVRTLQRIISH